MRQPRAEAIVATLVREMPAESIETLGLGIGVKAEEVAAGLDMGTSLLTPPSE